METFSETCHCGRVFAQVYAYTNHQRTCKKSRKRLAGALAMAQEVWRVRKRPRCLSDAQIDSFAEPHATLPDVNTIIVRRRQVRRAL